MWRSGQQNFSEKSKISFFKKDKINSQNSLGVKRKTLSESSQKRDVTENKILLEKSKTSFFRKSKIKNQNYASGKAENFK